MAERWIRISDLYARDDVRKIDNYYCVSLSSLSASLEQYGFKIVPTSDGHGTQGEPAAPLASDGHETAVGGG